MEKTIVQSSYGVCAVFVWCEKALKINSTCTEDFVLKSAAHVMVNI